MRNKTQLARALYVNLSEQDAAEQLLELDRKLRLLSDSTVADIGGFSPMYKDVPKLKIEPEEVAPVLELANDCEYKTRTVEMLGANLAYKIAQFAKEHEVRDSALVADDLAQKLAHVGVKFKRRGKQRRIIVSTRKTEFTYDQYGTIQSASGPEIEKYSGLAEKLEGQDALHYLACHVQQDLAVVMKKGDKMVYTFDCSMYEKTPKDVETGENKFLGKDLLDFHGKAETFGHILPNLLRNLVSCFSQGRLDLLEIDLKGANVYSNGEHEVRRFETDYVTPIVDNGTFHGILAYADVLFQDAAETRSPYKGGIIVPHQVNFHKEYKVVKNAT
jgi:hypothetical protein